MYVVVWVRGFGCFTCPLLTILLNQVDKGNPQVVRVTVETYTFWYFVAMMRPLNLADVCILLSGVKCYNRRLLAFQRFNWTKQIAQVERRTVFMKQMSSELRSGPN